MMCKSVFMGVPYNNPIFRAGKVGFYCLLLADYQPHNPVTSAYSSD